LQGKPGDRNYLGNRYRVQKQERKTRHKGAVSERVAACGAPKVDAHSNGKVSSSDCDGSISGESSEDAEDYAAFEMAITAA
jgi:hypothetical protein